MKKILITGVTGFIGSHLAQELSRKHEVYGAVRPCTSRDVKSLQPYLEKTKIVRCDITDQQSVDNSLQKINPDVVIHLAALSPVRDSFEAPMAYVHTNVHGTLHIAHGMLKLPDFKRKRLLYASTAEVYGIQEGRRVPEDAALNPSSPYANTKSMTDTYLRMMTPVYGLNTLVLRCINSYGRKLDTGFFVEYVITTMLQGGKVYVGAPDSTRDYMYVSDHVNAYIAALNHPEVNGEAFNATPGGEIPNGALALKIADMMGFPRKNVLLGKYPPNYPLRPIASDQPHIDLDATKIKRRLGWKPEVTLDDGLRRTIEYWKPRVKPGA
jgi:nucleoside-diphosphate-sugar epimerase